MIRNKTNVLESWKVFFTKSMIDSIVNYTNVYNSKEHKNYNCECCCLDIVIKAHVRNNIDKYMIIRKND